MGIDLSIYNGLLRPPKSVADYDAENQSFQQNALALQGTRQQQADASALRAATAGFGNDQTANYNALLKTGNMKAAQDYQAGLDKSRSVASDITKNTAQTNNYNSEVSARALEQSVKAHDFHVQQLGALSNPADVPAWIASGVQTGVFTPDQAQAGMQRFQQAVAQPGGFEAWKQQALQGGMSATEQLKLQADALKQKEQARHNVSTETLTGRGQDLTAASAKEGHAIAVRGQNMADARSKESTAAVMTKPFEVTGPDGTPLLVQQDKQGNITPVQGFGPKVGSSKPLNDTQAKALGFGTRMQQADDLLNGLVSKGVKTPSIAQQTAGDIPFLAPIANAMSSPDQQSVEQAQRDFVNAVLRRESGAAISSSEFDNARKQYFPQRGDSDQVITQKAANRKLATEGVIAEVPVGQRGTIGPKKAAAPAGGAFDADKERRYQEWKAQQK